MNYNKIIYLFRKLSNWISHFWLIEIKDSAKLIDFVARHYQSMLLNSGPETAIRRIKFYRLCYTRFIAGAPLHSSTLRIGLTPDGLPKCLGPLNEVIRKMENQGITFCLTLLLFSRVIPSVGKPKLESIEMRSVMDKTIHEEIRNWIFDKDNMFFLTQQRLKPFSEENIYWSNKAGIQGKATLTSWIDALNLPVDLIEKLDIVSPGIKRYILEVRELLPETSVKDSLGRALKRVWKPDAIRKLSIVNDPESKARIIAIFDYWSQCALKPLHSKFFELLRDLPCDRTFTQNPLFTSPNPESRFFSYDLSSATDRFPLIIQKWILTRMISEEFANAWGEILTGYNFTVPWEPGRVISYNAGQPMGAYSSWAVFAYSHHMVVQFAAHRAGVTLPFEQYILLGDDIVINHEAVAEQYGKVINGLGVEISDSKSHISFEAYEFAKRWFYRGKEVGGFPLGGFIENIGKYHLLFEEIRTLYDRQRIPRVVITIPGLMLSLYKRLNYYPKEIKSLMKKIEKLYLLSRIMHNADYGPFREWVAKTIPESPNTLWYNNWPVLNEQVRFMFYRSAVKVMHEVASNNISYVDNLRKSSIYNRMIEGLINPSDLYTGPQWYLSRSPIWAGLTNQLESLKAAFRALDYTKMREIVTLVAIPDPNTLFASRAAIRISNAKASLAINFANEVIGSFRNSPTGLEPSNDLLALNYAINSLNAVKNKSRTDGLFPGPINCPPKSNKPSNTTTPNYKVDVCPI